MPTAHARPGAGSSAHGEALDTERAEPGRREITARTASGPAALLALQRSAGNRVASAYLQRHRAAPPAPAMGPVAAPAQAEAATATQEAETVEAAEPERGSRTTELFAAAAPVDPPRDGAPAPVQRGLLDSVVGGITSLAGGVRDRVLGTLAGWARRMPGYELLCTILGRDVVAGTPIPRNAAAIIGGVLALIPGADRIRQNLQEAGAINKAGEWLDSEVPKLGLNWETIRGLFQRAWDALGPADLLNPAGAWQRISGIFGPPLARLRDFAVTAGKKMLEFVFEGALSLAGGLGSQVMGIIRRAGGVFEQIIANPVGFAGNLVAAVRGGLGAFLTNVATHLRNGLIGWLTGSLGGIIRIPAQFNLRGIVGMALDFLGITWDRVKGKLARLIGDRAVNMLEHGAGIVHDIVERGLGVITEKIAEFTGGIVDTVLGGIREWVTNSVVGAAITRLISMFNPAGAVIQAIIAVYNTVQFFIERAQQLGALASAVFDSIAAIASGGIGGAIRYVEQALGRAVPVVLGFLARLIGLGDVAAPVRNVMQRVQTVIDGALDRVVGWIAGLARRVGGALRGRRASGAPTAGTRGGDLRPALSDANRLLDAPGATESSVRSGLDGLRRRHQLTTAALVAGRSTGSFHIHLQRTDVNTQDKSLATSNEEILRALTDPPLPSLEFALDMFSPETHAFVSYPGSTVHYQNNSGRHAEWEFDADLRSRLPSLIDEGAYPRGSTVPVTIRLNRTPCDACAEVLHAIQAATIHGRRIDLTILSSSIYGGSRWESRLVEGGGSRSARVPVPRSSLDALARLKGSGATLGVWDIWTQIATALAADDPRFASVQELVRQNQEASKGLERHLRGVQARLETPARRR